MFLARWLLPGREPGYRETLYLSRHNPALL